MVAEGKHVLGVVELKDVVKGGIKIEAQHQGGGMEFTTTGTLGSTRPGHATAQQPRPEKERAADILRGIELA